MDAEGGLLVGLADAMHQLVAGGHALRAGQLRERIAGVVEHARAGLGEMTQRAEKRALPLMDLIEHRDDLSQAKEAILAPIGFRRVASPQSPMPVRSATWRRNRPVAAVQQQLVDATGVAQPGAPAQWFLEAQAERHQHAVVPPHRALAAMRKVPLAEFEQARGLRLH